MKRKDIDLFLKELNSFLEKYYNKDHNPMDELYNIFKIWEPKHCWKGKDLNVDLLVSLINKDKVNWYIRKDLRDKVENVKQSRRSEWYLKKVANNIEYIEVRDFSYQNIFFKIIFNHDNFYYKPNEVFWEATLAQFKQDLKKFYIPKDWYHDDKLYTYDSTPVEF